METPDYQSAIEKTKKPGFWITHSEDRRKNARLKAGQKRRIRLGDSQTATTFSSSQSMPEKGPKEQFDQTVCVNKFPAEQAENLGVKMTTLLNALLLHYSPNHPARGSLVYFTN
ncbi:hypothetical protein [Limnobacter alexandrii]|uniref:hypothetical protein n=1 Tax=Limnobacter alexandrii TaxID=2570352 RepID=UPI001107FA86|nr:hypothetical protein [Limnobacter alexandrii]